MKNLDDPTRNHESVENPADLIMTAEEYAGIEHETPYVFKAVGDGVELEYFGAKHSRTVGDGTFAELQSEFVNFAPDIVLVEGLANLENKKDQKKEWLRTHSEDHIISQMGEAGFALKLAADRDINFASPEPGLKAEAQALEEQGFSRDEIFAYYVYRNMPQWHQHEIKPDVRDYLEHDIQNIAHGIDWQDYNFSFNHAVEIGQTMWGTDLNLEDEDFYSTRTDPIPWKEQEGMQGVVNLVSRASSRFRDRYMVGEIAKVVETYKRPFVVFGGSHAVMQEPAIREIIESQVRRI